jgi:hypothetical protein
MLRISASRFAVAVAGAITVLLTRGPHPAGATPKAFSTDGEATVYQTGDFRGSFVLSYDVTMRRFPSNRSWSVVGVTVLGDAPPSDGITVGVMPTGSGANVFTSSVRNGKATYRDSGLSCADGCRIELRATRTTIAALRGTTVVQTWPRTLFRLPRPAVQINAETSAVGDRLAAVIAIVRAEANGTPLPQPECAFSTKGIDVVRVRNGALRYTGVFDASAPRYESLATGRRGDSCAAAR